MSRLRVWQNLKYYDPRRILVGLNNIAETQPLEELPEDVRSLRQRGVREYGESRQCALFCFGVGEALGIDVSYAHCEESDHDFVARYYHNDTLKYVPIQMKELVPESLNPKAALNKVIEKLDKYADSADLCIAIHLNRAETIDFSELEIPRLNLKELWLFGASAADLSQWLLVGNMLKDRNVYEFRYPTS